MGCSRHVHGGRGGAICSGLAAPGGGSARTPCRVGLSCSGRRVNGASSVVCYLGRVDVGGRRRAVVYNLACGGIDGLSGTRPGVTTIGLLVTTASECAARCTTASRSTPSTTSASSTAELATLPAPGGVLELRLRDGCGRLFVFLAVDGPPLFGATWVTYWSLGVGTRRARRTFEDPSRRKLNIAADFGQE